MPGLVPGICDFPSADQAVNGRDKPGYDCVSLVSPPSPFAGEVLLRQPALQEPDLAVGLLDADPRDASVAHRIGDDRVQLRPELRIAQAYIGEDQQIGAGIDRLDDPL